MLKTNLSELKHLTIAVAGHVDHGKTALVQALTGIETDRLAEEKERGMSIVLGFAPLVLREGVIDLIDSPGHERFVGTMIAGASGVDALLLVIAATEQTKPQTVEHLRLAELLGIKRGIVAVTKSDLVDEQQRLDIERNVSSFVEDTFLSRAPIIFTSAATRAGIGELRAQLATMLTNTQPRATGKAFYMPIDRAFVMAGHGTVVTGTLYGGSLSAGDSVEIVPGGTTAEVRGIQIHGQAVQTASPGWRTAVNLRGIKKDQLPHGAALAKPGSLRPTNILDVELRLLATAKPIKRGDVVRLYFGTGDYNARVYPLRKPMIDPGETSFAQLRLTQPVMVPISWRFAIRSLTPPATVGGGTILDTHPVKKSALSEQGLSLLEALISGDARSMVEQKTLEASYAGRNASELTSDLGLEHRAESPRVQLCRNKILVHDSVLDDLQSRIVERISEFHAQNPKLEGISSDFLRHSQPPRVAAEVFQTAIKRLVASGAITRTGGVLSTSGFHPQPLTSTEQRAFDSVANSFRRAKLQPPTEDTVTHGDPERLEYYKMLLKSGALVEVGDRSTGGTITFHSAAIKDAEAILSKLLQDSPEGCTVSEIDKALSTTRKFAIPLLEYFDAMGKTKRTRHRRFWSEE